LSCEKKKKKEEGVVQNTDQKKGNDSEGVTTRTETAGNKRCFNCGKHGR